MTDDIQRMKIEYDRGVDAAYFAIFRGSIRAP
jgi:hypothetical protein